MQPFLHLLAQRTGLTQTQLNAYFRQHRERWARLLAVEVKFHPLPEAALELASEAQPMALLDDQFFRALPNYGPQGQDAFAYRFPQTAQDARTAKRRMSFVSLFTWAGKTRELSSCVVHLGYPRLLEALGSNKMTAATSSYETRVISELPLCDELIEVRMWSEAVTDLTCAIIFEWWRIPFPGQAAGTMFAWSRMQISSIEILGHGLVQARPWPQFFAELLREMGPRREATTPEPTAHQDLGRELFAKPVGPALGPLLFEQPFHTTSEESNLVGNIYFANYGVWQARVRDLWLYSLWPEYAHGFHAGDGEELMCTYFNIEHLQEALPFDRISVALHLTRLYERGAEFQFVYHKLLPSGQRVKLAVCAHTAQWVRYTPTGEAQSVPWPAPLMQALQRVTHSPYAGRHSRESESP